MKEQACNHSQHILDFSMTLCYKTFMITRIQPYSQDKNQYKPVFCAVISKGHYIPVKRRGEIIPENIMPEFFARVREIFFEMFPKLDPEYKKI